MSIKIKNEINNPYIIRMYEYMILNEYIDQNSWLNVLILSNPTPLPVAVVYFNHPAPWFHGSIFALSGHKTEK